MVGLLGDCLGGRMVRTRAGGRCLMLPIGPGPALPPPSGAVPGPMPKLRWSNAPAATETVGRNALPQRTAAR